ncbi:hypothetical protein, partial [Escherichia coli]|uniref:hypothetical protein n=1 Tax=Escherichia coli TaxID=562 RepID=UPI001BC87461
MFLLAADCFREALFPTFPESDVEAARLAAQRMLDETLNGGDNYYLCASFSEASRVPVGRRLLQGGALSDIS